MNAYGFTAELSQFKPRIWRRFLVPANITVAKLGYIIMTLFEMKADHLFSIEYKSENKIESKSENKKIRFDIDIEMGRADWKSAQNASKTYLSSLDILSKSSISMFYDFSRGWEVSLAFEKLYDIPIHMTDSLPRALEGERYGIVEGCGGGAGLSKLMKAFAVKSGDDYKELSEKFGRKNFNFNKFSVSRANERLRIIPEIYRQVYEEQISPTDEENEYIERGMI
ncbi:MAG: plasmid pRiA4b ORF-3 family protein [Clostridiales bacterium]|jgi:hypothetical protein|nr:plasmid pRiA4b ORF-3 family protein [Clostridiales bacterium]